MKEELIKEMQYTLMRKYKVSPSDALEAIHEAYIKVQDAVSDPDKMDNFDGYWYIASKNTLLNTLMQRKGHRSLEEYHMNPVYQEEVPEGSTTTETLMKTLKGSHLYLFKRLLKGHSIPGIAEDIGVTKTTVYRYRDELIYECRSILSDKNHYNDKESSMGAISNLHSEVTPEDVYSDKHEYGDIDNFRFLVANYFDAVRKKKGMNSTYLSTKLGKAPSSVAVNKYYGISSFDLFFNYCEALDIDPIEALEDCMDLWSHFKEDEEAVV